LHLSKGHLFCQVQVDDLLQWGPQTPCQCNGLT
jgi:hypothetical protein